MNIDTSLALHYFGLAMFNFGLSGFLGGSETAFLSINRIFLYARSEKGSLSARILVFLVERSSNFITAIVVANNVTLVLGTLCITHMLMAGFGLDLFWTTFLGIVVTTPFQLVVGEVLPKALFHPFSNVLAYKFSIFWMLIYIALLPIVLLFKLFFFVVHRLFNVNQKNEGGFAQSEFQDLLDVSLKSGALNEEERGFINNILEFRDIRASEAMTPLSHLDCIEESETVAKALSVMHQKQQSVLPVYRARLDNPIGRIRAKDLLNAQPEALVSEYVEEAFFIPEAAHLEKVLVQMRRRKFPLAFVADEYGGIVGVLKIEDIASEIVGEVIEEGEIEFKVNDDGSILADGLCDVDDLFDVLKFSSSDVESKTIGGYLMEQLGRMPEAGDIIYSKPWYFQVLSLRGRSIQNIFISKNKPSS